MVCAFEHEVFEVVCKACCFSRVVARACVYGDKGLHARLFLVHAKIYFKTVAEGIDSGFHRVARHCCVPRLLRHGKTC